MSQKNLEKMLLQVRQHKIRLIRLRFAARALEAEISQRLVGTTSTAEVVSRAMGF